MGSETVLTTTATWSCSMSTHGVLVLGCAASLGQKPRGFCLQMIQAPPHPQAPHTHHTLIGPSSSPENTSQAPSHMVPGCSIRQRVDLVKEEDGGNPRARGLEEGPQELLGLAPPLGGERGGAAVEEGDVPRIHLIDLPSHQLTWVCATRPFPRGKCPFYRGLCTSMLT